MPIIDDEGNLQELDPVFIDFELMKQVNSTEEARDKMGKKLEHLLNIYSEFIFE